MLVFREKIESVLIFGKKKSGSFFFNFVELQF